MPLRVIDLASVSAIHSLAAAYAIAERLAPDGDPTVLLAHPIEPFLCVGASQNIERDVDLSFCRAHAIRIVRRRLGGGAIYIDGNQLLFHIIVPARCACRPVPRTLEAFAAPVIDTHRDLGIAARLRPPGDVAVGARKIAGTAGAAIGDNVLVGGTFLFDFDAAVMAHCLKAPSEAFRARLARLIERGMTTLRRELGAPPPRVAVKRRFVVNLARCVGAEPLMTGVSDEERATIAIAAERLEDTARQD
jgi:lipoate---protein ligase